MAAPVKCVLLVGSRRMGAAGNHDVPVTGCVYVCVRVCARACSPPKQVERTGKNSASSTSVTVLIGWGEEP